MTETIELCYDYSFSFLFSLDNSVWKFDLSPSVEKWSYVIGSNNTGTTAILANQPTPRWVTGCAPHSTCGAYCFGGTGYNPAGTVGRLADLWYLNTATKTWTLVDGDSTIAANGGILPTRPGHRGWHAVVSDKVRGIIYVIMGSGESAGASSNLKFSKDLIAEKLY